MNFPELLNLWNGYALVARIIMAACVVVFLGVALFGPRAAEKSEPAKSPPPNEPLPSSSNSGSTLPPQPSQKPPVQAESEPMPVEWLVGEGADIFGWNEGADGTFLVGTFNFRGRNLSGVPLVNVEAVVQPELAKNALPLFFVDRGQYIYDTKSVFVEPGAEFQLSYIIPPENPQNLPQGVTVETYLRKFGGVELRMRYGNQQTTRKAFSYAQVRDAITARKLIHDQARRPVPGLRPLSE